MISRSGKKVSIDSAALRGLVLQSVVALQSKASSAWKKVLIVPPDHTRLNSQAGPITNIVYEHLMAQDVQVDIMPALGTHNEMTEAQLRMMFGDAIPLSKFLYHDWRNEVVHKGTLEGDWISELSEGKVDYSVKVEVNKKLFEGYDLILSVGQVVPHEVVGMANYTKNIVVGVGGSDIIHKSHFLGAVAGIEKILGQRNTPVRKLFNRAVKDFLSDLPIEYMLTVMEKDEASEDMHMRGFFAGDEPEVFSEACDLARAVNIIMLDKEPAKVVVYLDPHEFQSTWLGNKAIYRTRMAIADDGELIILAPSLKEFGEDETIDRLIRAYGYKGTPHTLKAVDDDPELRANLGAAAHLIHGASEGRFSITYCPGEGGLSLEELRSVGYEARPYAEEAERYNSATLKDGFNLLPDGEEIYFIRNPALGLWAYKEKFKDES